MRIFKEILNFSIILVVVSFYTTFSFSKTDMPGSVNHIAIIDDVVTTMATVKSLATCLESRGIRQVDV